jgi:hypothetical protein
VEGLLAGGWEWSDMSDHMDTPKTVRNQINNRGAQGFSRAWPFGESAVGLRHTLSWVRPKHSTDSYREVVSAGTRRDPHVRRSACHIRGGHTSGALLKALSSGHLDRHDPGRNEDVELRGSRTTVRGRIALIQAGSKHLVGPRVSDVVGPFPPPSSGEQPNCTACRPLIFDVQSATRRHTHGS